MAVCDRANYAWVKKEPACSVSLGGQWLPYWLTYLIKPADLSHITQEMTRLTR